MVGSTFSSPDVESDDGDFPTHSPLLSGESYFSICVGSLFSQESKSCLNWLKAPAPVLNHYLRIAGCRHNNTSYCNRMLYAAFPVFSAGSLRSKSKQRESNAPHLRTAQS